MIFVVTEKGEKTMTESEFETNYCLLCGTQRCGGIHDKIFREGCSHYQKEMLGKQTLHEMLEEVNRLYRKIKGADNDL